MWLKVVGLGILVVIGIMGGDFGGFVDMVDRIDVVVWVMFEVVKGGVICE